MGSFDFYSAWPHKPLMISEGAWGSSGSADGITWINDWFDMQTNFPRMKAAVWFNSGTAPALDITLASTSITDVFKARIADQYFLARSHAGMLDYNGDDFVSLPDLGAVAEQWMTNVSNNSAVAHEDITYTIDATTPFTGSYPDSTGDELANGIVGAFDLADSDWTGFFGGLGYTLLTFDLGNTYDLTSMDVTYMVYMSAGVWAPKDMEVSFSTDGVSYTSPITLTGFTEFEWSAPTIAFGISESTGRYVKIKVNANGNRTDIFTFLSEFTFKGLANAPADINGDDLINNMDVDILIRFWLN